MAVVALETEQAKAVAIVAIVAVVIIGAVVAAIVRAIIARAIVLVVALVLAGIVWSQRADIASAAKRCDATFFGIHLTASNDAQKRKCRDTAG